MKSGADAVLLDGEEEGSCEEEDDEEIIIASRVLVLCELGAQPPLPVKKGRVMDDEWIATMNVLKTRRIRV